MLEPRQWRYIIGEEVVEAAAKIASAPDVLNELDPDVRDAVLLVCQTIDGDEAEVVR